MAILRRIKILYLEGEFKITPRQNRYKFMLENGDIGSARITKNMRFKLYGEGRLIAKAKLNCDQLVNYNGTGKADDEYLSLKEAGLTRRSIYKAIKRNGAEASAAIVYEPNNMELPDSNSSYLSDIRESDYALDGFTVRILPNQNDNFQELFGAYINVNLREESRNFEAWTPPSGSTYFCAEL